jgi:hypothetical protein
MFVHICIYACICICLYRHIFDKKKTDITDYDGDDNDFNQYPNRYIHIDICTCMHIYILHICAYMYIFISMYI